MAFDFPDSPVDGETFTDAASGVSYSWNGYAWKTVSSGGGGTPPVSGDYVLKAGDTMSGALILPAPFPTLPEEAANKSYVDAIVSLGTLPPPNPQPNALWWQSDTGSMHVYYDDGDSQQWVEIGGASGAAAAIRPTATAVVPRVVGATDPDLTVSVQGTGFTDTSQIYDSITPLPTGFVSDTELTFDISPVGEGTGRHYITVNNGGVSSVPPLEFDVTFHPIVTSITPTTAAAGGADFTLTVQGGQFTSHPEYPTVVWWDGAPIPTNTVTSQTVATATITPDAVAGTHEVTVQNGPVVSLSTPQTFTYT